MKKEILVSIIALFAMVAVSCSNNNEVEEVVDTTLVNVEETIDSTAVKADTVVAEVADAVEANVKEVK